MQQAKCRRIFVGLALTIFVLCSAQIRTARAEPTSRHSLTFDNRLAGRLNPLGTTDQFRLRYRYRLFNSSHLLLKETFVGVFASAEVTPAFFRAGGGVEVQPVSFLRLTAMFEGGPWYSTNDCVLSFDSPHADYSDTELDRLGDAGERYFSTAWFVTLSALLRFRYKSIALLNELKAIYVSMKLHDGDTVWWDPILDLAVPANGWAINNDTSLVWISRFGLIAGVRYTMSHVFYSDSDFLPGESRKNPNGPTHRLGPLVAYRFNFKRKAFQYPAVALVVNWWIKHRYRTGRSSHQAYPYIALAFSFKGQLL